MNQIERNQCKYNEAFTKVMTLYQEYKASGGGLEPLGTRINSKAIIAPTSPTISDFLCDVDLNASRVLSEGEYNYFCNWYRCLFWASDNPHNNLMDDRIRHKLGHRFIQVGIYPVEKYIGKTQSNE